jgi:hypothetical protein
MSNESFITITSLTLGHLEGLVKSALNENHSENAKSEVI